LSKLQKDGNNVQSVRQMLPAGSVDIYVTTNHNERDCYTKKKNNRPSGLASREDRLTKERRPRKVIFCKTLQK